MRLAIVGSRNCPRIDLSLYLDCQPDVIVSGGARGVDTYAREYAMEHHIPLIEFKPDYIKYGQRAPLVRNRWIVEGADKVLAFWDGKSRGTMHTVEYAKKLGKPVRIVLIQDICK